MERIYPWRMCGLCSFLSDNHEWCEIDPYPIATCADRHGCRFWECAGCGGPYDDGEDHTVCMDGLGLVRIV